jgi:lysozyme family protein
VKNHSHHYSCKGGRPAYRGGKVDVYALQRKLKAKGYYKGPIDGIVGSGTRSALKRFMNR